MSRAPRVLIAVALVLSAVALAAAAPAMADFGLKGLDVTFNNQDGTPATAAGTHPFAMTTKLALNTTVEPKVGELPEGELKDLLIEQVTGLAGNPRATTRCTAAEFSARVEGYASCPDSTAVGVAAVKAEFNAFPPETEVFLHLPIYNLVPPPGVAAKLGFVAANVPVTFDVGVSGEPPYDIVASLRDIPQSLLFYGSEVTLWGNPASPAHDSLRGKCVGSPTEPTAEAISKGKCSSSGPEVAFLTLPRSCQGPLATSFFAGSWQGATSAGSAIHPGFAGCDELSFAAEVGAEPTTQSAESASGLEFTTDVNDPGLTDPTGRAQSDIRKVVVTLPEGVTLNPSAAEGMGSCRKTQYESEGLDVPSGSGCPSSSKLGTVEVVSPLLEGALPGELFLAQQDDPATAEAGAENPFDSMLAVYLVIRSPQFGIFVKQAGKIEADKRTGRLVSTFEDIPQLPFGHLDVRFRGGPRAPLVTPPTCGRYSTGAELTPWSGGPALNRTATFDVTSGRDGGPCPAAGTPPFHPGFEAGSLDNKAGSYSPFYMRLSRQDGEQELTRFDSKLPPGLTGKLTGVAKCGDAAIAAAGGKTGRQELANASCPPSSQVGRTLAAAGVGSALTYVPGKLYLAGPFAGDPLSIVAITPAVAGPIDVGNVVVREALTLDPETAEVQIDGAHSDSLPRILQGIPVRLRQLEVYVDRDDFTLNPTSCDPSSVRANIFGSFADVFSPGDDVSAAVSQRYQAARCSALGFRPKLSLKLKGGTRRNDFPALRAVVKYPRRGSYANIRQATVTLPHSAFLEQGHIGTVCTRVQFAADACPKRSIYGRAKAITPLLDEPLEGPVYLRSSSHPLPDLVAALHGVVDVDVVGRIDSVKARLRSRFESVPDAPVSKFILEMRGGKKGLIVNSRDLCEHPERASVDLVAQNGKAAYTNPVLANSCRKRKKR
jgi:hypothetical protein